MRFETHGVLSASTGILMGDIGALYAVASYLLGRPAYTHELAYYGARISKALRVCHPELPGAAPNGTWQQLRDDFIAQHGAQMELDGALKGVLADDKDPITTLREMGFKGEIIAVSGDAEGGDGVHGQADKHREAIDRRVREALLSGGAWSAVELYRMTGHATQWGTLVDSIIIELRDKGEILDVRFDEPHAVWMASEGAKRRGAHGQVGSETDGGPAT